MITWNAPEAGSYEQTSTDGRYLLVDEPDGWTEVVERETLELVASGYVRGEVLASADKYADGVAARDEEAGDELRVFVAEPATTAVTLDEAMTAVLRLARKLDLPNTDDAAREVADLGDLLTRLGAAVTSHAAVISARVVSDQHAALNERERTDRTRAIAAASRETVTQARTSATNARTRVAEAIVAYGTRD